MKQLGNVLNELDTSPDLMTFVTQGTDPIIDS